MVSLPWNRDHRKAGHPCDQLNFATFFVGDIKQNPIVHYGHFYKKPKVNADFQQKWD